MTRGHLGRTLRVRCWLLRHGYTLAEIQQDAEGEVKRIDGMPWTVLFGQWLRERWDAWAAQQGYTRRNGTGDRETAQLEIPGAQDKFDAWLVDDAKLCRCVDVHKCGACTLSFPRIYLPPGAKRDAALEDLMLDPPHPNWPKFVGSKEARR